MHRFRHNTPTNSIVLWLGAKAKAGEHTVFRAASKLAG
jgi:hypothetical protein